MIWEEPKERDEFRAHCGGQRVGGWDGKRRRRADEPRTDPRGTNGKTQQGALLYLTSIPPFSTNDSGRPLRTLNFIIKTTPEPVNNSHPTPSELRRALWEGPLARLDDVLEGTEVVRSLLM